jgi:hypothetical protein
VDFILLWTSLGEGPKCSCKPCLYACRYFSSSKTACHNAHSLFMTSLFFCMRRILLLLILATAAHAQTLTVTKEMRHLRNGDQREWSTFSANADRSATISFDVSNPADWKTVRLRQQDVKQPWDLLINNKKIGSLVADEKDLTIYFPLPSNTLTAGKNNLTISSKSTISDDVRIGNIVLLAGSADETQSQASVTISVIDRSVSKPVPARVTIFDENKSMHQVAATNTEGHLAIRPGCVYTSNGNVSLRLVPGRYTIYANRGFEYSVDSTTVDLKKGDTTITLGLSREVDTKGLIACDTHVHTYSHSGHGDATDQERVITLAGEGVELAVITDHNQHVDLRSAASAAGVDKYFTLITGNEVTTKVGHFNVFPLSASATPVDPQAENWKDLKSKLRPDRSVVILNHGNDVHNDFRPLDASRHVAFAGVDLQGWPFPANAMEVVNSGSQQSDAMQLFHQWMGMLNSGNIITPVGSSDSHDVSRYIVGQGRTYIFGKDDDPSHIDVGAAVKAFREGRVLVSSGLLTRVSVEGRYGPGDLAEVRKSAQVQISVQAPSWVRAEHVTLFVNGVKVHEEDILAETLNTKWSSSWKIDNPGHDVFVTAVATGRGDHIPFWPIEKPYQATGPEWTPAVVGFSGAVWIDGDGDGARSTARDYAQLVIDESKKLNLIISELEGYDKAVAVQTAVLLSENGVDLSGDEVKGVLPNAAPHVRQAFDEVRVALKK